MASAACYKFFTLPKVCGKIARAHFSPALSVFSRLAVEYACGIAVNSIRYPAPLLQEERLQSLRRKAARWLVRTTFGPNRGVASEGWLPIVGIHRILVCHVSHTLGNTLLLTPLLRELEQVYPGSEIDVVTRSPAAEEIFGGFASVRRIHRVPRHGLAAPWQLMSVVRALRERHYDLAIDPCVGSQSDRIGVLAANATWRLGFVAPGKSGALSHGVARPEDVRHVGQLPVHLLRSALGQPAGSPYPCLDICLTADERAEGARGLAQLVGVDVPMVPIIGLFGNATGAKHLGAEWWQRFARRLEERCPEQRMIEIVPVDGASLLANRYPAFYSSNVRRLAGALSALSLFVSADCGVMHLACASGAPTVGLFSLPNSAEWGPYGARNRILEIGMRTPEEIADALGVTR